MLHWNTTAVINSRLLLVDRQKQRLVAMEQSSQQYRSIEIANVRLENVTHLISVKQDLAGNEHGILMLTTTHIHYVQLDAQLTQARRECTYCWREDQLNPTASMDRTV